MRLLNREKGVSVKVENINQLVELATSENQGVYLLWEAELQEPVSKVQVTPDPHPHPMDMSPAYVINASLFSSGKIFCSGRAFRGFEMRV